MRRLKGTISGQAAGFVVTHLVHVMRGTFRSTIDGVTFKELQIADSAALAGGFLTADNLDRAGVRSRGDVK